MFSQNLFLPTISSYRDTVSEANYTIMSWQLQQYQHLMLQNVTINRLTLIDRYTIPLEIFWNVAEVGIINSTFVGARACANTITSSSFIFHKFHFSIKSRIVMV